MKFPLAGSAALFAETPLTLPTYGGLVSWKDGTGAACGESVTLTKNSTTFNSGRLIATITPTGEGDKTAKIYTYPYAIMPQEMSVRTRDGAKASFSFNDGWVAPTTMNDTPYTEMEFKVYGTTGDNNPEGVTWAVAAESETELANNVGKFNNISGIDQTVAMTQGAGAQENMRMQIGADFKLVQGYKFTFNISGAENVVNIPFDFDNGTFTLKERSNDVVRGMHPENITTYNTVDYDLEPNKWNRIEIDYSNIGFVYDVYLNGIKVNQTPLNMGCVSGNSNYYANTFRFLSFTIPTGHTLLLDNVTVAETALKNAKALVDGALRRLERNFATDNSFYNGEALYNDLNDTGVFPV